MQTAPVTIPRPISRLSAIFVRKESFAFQSRITGNAAPMKSVTMENTPCTMMIFSTARLEKQ